MKNLFEAIRKHVHGKAKVMHAYLRARLTVLRGSGEEPFGAGPKHPLP
jgi:hypothetical protein